MNGVLFVCLGNICRSPAAEGVMRHVVAGRQDAAHVTVDSAGTSAYHVGESADARMRQAAARRGYRLTSLSRQVTRADFERFGWIVAMDRQNLRDLEQQQADAEGGGAALHLLSDFLPSGSPIDVPDPYYGGKHGFETVLDLLETACPVLLQSILAKP